MTVSWASLRVKCLLPTAPLKDVHNRHFWAWITRSTSGIMSSANARSGNGSLYHLSSTLLEVGSERTSATSSNNHCHKFPYTQKVGVNEGVQDCTRRRSVIWNVASGFRTYEKLCSIFVYTSKWLILQEQSAWQRFLRSPQLCCHDILAQVPREFTTFLSSTTKFPSFINGSDSSV